MSKQKMNPKPIMKAFALMSSISSYVIGAALLGIFGGRFLDQQFGGGGLYIALAILISMTAAMFGIYRTIQHFFKEPDKDSRGEDKDG